MGLPLGKFRYGENLAGASAILLLAFTFLDWFGSKDSGELRLFSVGRSAWEALDYIPIVLLITIIAALSVVALRLANTLPKLPVPAGSIVASLGIVSMLLTLFRIVDPPNFGSFREIWGNVTIEGTPSRQSFSPWGLLRASRSAVAWRCGKNVSPRRASRSPARACWRRPPA